LIHAWLDVRGTKFIFAMEASAMESRRAFLGRCGAAGAVWTALGNGDWSRLSAAAAEFDVGRLGALAAFAIERALAAGAAYADIRINRY
jgi:hypothetical protein